MRRREGGREGEVIPHVWESAVTVATEGMLGNLNPLGDGPGRSLADHGARVPEVLALTFCIYRLLEFVRCLVGLYCLLEFVRCV